MQGQIYINFVCTKKGIIKLELERPPEYARWKDSQKRDLSLMPLFQTSIVRQPIQQADTQDHDEQPNGHYYEQGESEPS